MKVIQIRKCPLSLKILSYHVQPLEARWEQKEDIQILSIQKVKSPCVSLATVQCQSSRDDCRPETGFCGATYGQTDRQTDRQTLFGQNALRLALTPVVVIGGVKINAQSRSEFTFVYSKREEKRREEKTSPTCPFFGSDSAYLGDLAAHSLPTGNAHTWWRCNTAQRHKSWRCNTA